MNFPSHRLSIDDSIVCCAAHARVVKLVRVFSSCHHLVMIMMMLITCNTMSSRIPIHRPIQLKGILPRWTHEGTTMIIRKGASAAKCTQSLRHCIESGIRACFTAARTLHMTRRAGKDHKHDSSAAKIIACFQKKTQWPIHYGDDCTFLRSKGRCRDSAAKAEKGTLQWPS